MKGDLIECKNKNCNNTFIKYTDKHCFCCSNCCGSYYMKKHRQYLKERKLKLKLDSEKDFLKSFGINDKVISFPVKRRGE